LKPLEAQASIIAWAFFHKIMPIQTTTSQPPFLLWVDGVGGYLVSRSASVTVGLASPAAQVDIPIFGDLKKEHARFVRDGESYLLDPINDCDVNKRVVDSTTLINHEDEIRIGGTFFKFHKPHVLSASARLDFLGRHRMSPQVDAVLLMAESCVLGPNWHNHVVCRDWAADVVLYQQGRSLFCRSKAPFTINSFPCDGKGELGGLSHVEGEDFSFSVEMLSAEKTTNATS